MAEPLPLQFVFYIAATPEKVWEGFVSSEANRTIFMGAEFEAVLKPVATCVGSVQDLTGNRPSMFAAKSSATSRRNSCNTPSPWVRVRTNPA